MTSFIYRVVTMSKPSYSSSKSIYFSENMPFEVSILVPVLPEIPYF